MVCMGKDSMSTDAWDEAMAAVKRMLEDGAVTSAEAALYMESAKWMQDAEASKCDCARCKTTRDITGLLPGLIISAGFIRKHVNMLKRKDVDALSKKLGDVCSAAAMQVMAAVDEAFQLDEGSS